MIGLLSKIVVPKSFPYRTLIGITDSTAKQMLLPKYFRKDQKGINYGY